MTTAATGEKGKRQEESDNKYLDKKIQTMRDAPIVLEALINYLVDEGLITDVELYYYIVKERKRTPKRKLI